MQRWKLTIEYKGTDYSGWQMQPDVPSIQEEIEKAITKFCQQEIRVHGAGRTDAGVHAKGQVAHFDLDYGDRDISAYELAKALNAHLRPNPVVVLRAEKVEETFHARFNATGKLYMYRILCRPSFLSIDQGLMWHFKKRLSLEAMRQGASFLIGHHDFSTFRDSQCQAKSPFKTLERLDIEEFEYDDHGGKEIRFFVQGKSFLHHQVRNMVGTLVLVGEEKWKPEEMKNALQACDRTKGGPTAPADGLYLIKVDY